MERQMMNNWLQKVKSLFLNGGTNRLRNEKGILTRQLDDISRIVNQMRYFRKGAEFLIVTSR